MHMPTAQMYDLQNVKLLYQVRYYLDLSLSLSLCYGAVTGRRGGGHFRVELVPQERHATSVEQGKALLFCIVAYHQHLRETIQFGQVGLTPCELFNALIHRSVRSLVRRYQLFAHIGSSIYPPDGKVVGNLRETYRVGLDTLHPLALTLALTLTVTIGPHERKANFRTEDGRVRRVRADLRFAAVCHYCRLK